MKPIRFNYLLILVFFITSNLFAGNSVKIFQNQNYGYIENKGQLVNQDYEANSQVLYFLSAKGVNVHLKQNGFSLEMVQQVDSSIVKFHRIDLVFEGANTNCKLEPSQKASGYINYFLNYTKEQGVPAGKGQTHVAHYGKVTYKDIYPGIDIEFMLDPKAEGAGYKYNVVVHSGASLSQVKLKVLGAQDLALNEKGNLVYSTSIGNIKESIPYSYTQTKEGSKQEAKVFYDLHSKTSFGFSSNANTNENKLVVDPIGWATYYGSSSLGHSPGMGISSPHIANVTIVGKTNCSVGIATFGAYIGSYQTSGDIFLTKFSNAGIQIWGTYYGGNSQDWPYGLDVDSNYNSYICGFSLSNSGIATTGSMISIKGGINNYGGIVAKFDSSGFLVWGTYLSDSTANYSRAWSICKSKTSQKIFVAGQVQGSIGLATLGSHSTTQFGGHDLLVYVFDYDGNRIWSTYFGGTGGEHSFSIKSNNLDQVYISGYTSSTTGIATVGAHKTSIQSVDAFIAKFDTTGNRIWGTYFGGASNDTIWDIMLDPSENVYICGSSNSTSGIATTGAYQTTGSTLYCKAFVNKFNSLGVRQWGTYYSGNINTKGTQISIDLSGNIVLAGTTNSTTGIATANTNQTSLTGSHNAFLAKLNPSGTARLWGTYFGGNQSEIINDVFINQDNEIYITGETNSNTGFATLGAHQTVANTNYSNTFIAVLSPNGGMPVTWKSFEANAYLENAQTKAILNWSTASESNNDYFTIERSFDAQAFEAIGKQKGASNSNKLNSYSYLDESPFNKSIANTEVYYRIKQTDFDGKFDYTPTKKLSLQETQQSPIKILYQDQQAIINWGTTLPENCQLELINLAGQIVWQTNINSANLFTQTPITYKGIAGIYLLRIKGITQEECFKILVE